MPLPSAVQTGKNSSVNLNDNRQEIIDERVGADGGSIAVGAGGVFNLSSDDNSQYFADYSDRSTSSFVANTTDNSVYQETTNIVATDHGAITGALELASRATDSAVQGAAALVAQSYGFALESQGAALAELADERAAAYGLAGTSLNFASNATDRVLAALQEATETAQAQIERNQDFALELTSDLYDANRSADEAIAQNIVKAVAVVAVVGLLAFAAPKFRR